MDLSTHEALTLFERLVNIQNSRLDRIVALVPASKKPYDKGTKNVVRCAVTAVKRSKLYVKWKNFLYFVMTNEYCFPFKDREKYRTAKNIMFKISTII